MQEGLYGTVLRVDPEFEALIPPLSAEELELLEASILAEGVREPVVVWDGVIVDGHNRHAICKKHRIKYPIVQRSFWDRDAALLWIIQNQLGRRNLHAMDKVPLAERRREILEAQARARQATSTGGAQPQLRQNFSQAEDTGKTNQKLAASVGVSRPTYEALKTVVEKGTPELQDAVRQNRVGASTAKRVATLPAETQREVAALPDRKAISAAVKDIFQEEVARHDAKVAFRARARELSEEAREDLEAIFPPDPDRPRKLHMIFGVIDAVKLIGGLPEPDVFVAMLKKHHLEDLRGLQEAIAWLNALADALGQKGETDAVAS